MMNVGYYCTIVRGKRVAYLLGPYDDEPTARSHVAEARRLACEIDPWADFDLFGTCRLESPDPLPDGRLNDRFEPGEIGQ